MKNNDYFKSLEKAQRTFIPDERYLILRMDGKAFHSYTKGLAKPFDTPFMDAMDQTAAILCQEIDGTVFAYVQSDEISVVVDTQKNVNTMPWLGGAVQKLVSISASICSVHFNNIRGKQGFSEKLAYFDSRVFSMKDIDGVEQYIQWRRNDAIKNSTSMAAESHFSHKLLTGKHSGERREMLAAIGNPWEDTPDGFKFGRVVHSFHEEDEVTYMHSRTQEVHREVVIRKKWKIVPASTEQLDFYLNG